jgi:hypothetical protein
MVPKLSAVLAVIAGMCILLSAFFGTSIFSDWLLNAAEALFVVAILMFGGYVVLGVIGDAGTL